MSELDPLGEVSRVNLVCSLIDRTTWVSQDEGVDIARSSIEVSYESLIDSFLRVVTFEVGRIKTEGHRTILVGQSEEGVSTHDECPVVVEVFLTSEACYFSERTLCGDEDLRVRPPEPATWSAEGGEVLRAPAVVSIGEVTTEVVTHEVEVTLVRVLLLGESYILELDEEGGDIVVITLQDLLALATARAVGFFKATGAGGQGE